MVVSMASAGLVVTAPTASAQDCGKLTVDVPLSAGQSLNSCNEAFRLSMQSDDNLVVYRTSDNFPLWNSRTADAAGGGRAVLQSDGNLVVYAQDGRDLWNSGTVGSAVDRGNIQDDGNLVLSTLDGRPVWNSFTASLEIFLGSFTPKVPSALYGADLSCVSASGQKIVDSLLAREQSGKPLDDDETRALISLLYSNGGEGGTRANCLKKTISTVPVAASIDFGDGRGLQSLPADLSIGPDGPQNSLIVNTGNGPREVLIAAAFIPSGVGPFLFAGAPSTSNDPDALAGEAERRLRQEGIGQDGPGGKIFPLNSGDDYLLYKAPTGLLLLENFFRLFNGGQRVLAPLPQDRFTPQLNININSRFGGIFD